MGLVMEILWESLKFWKKKKPKQGRDYNFYNFPDSDLTGIELLKGKYRKVVFFYKQAKVYEEGEFARLNFSYEIVHSGNHSEEDLKTDQEFVTIMGDILTDLMDKNEEIRTNDTEKLDL